MNLEDFLNAAAIGDVDAIDPALGAHAPNSADASGRTALYLAAKHGHTEVVRKLIAAGASVDAVNQRDPDESKQVELSSEQQALLKEKAEALLGPLQDLDLNDPLLSGLLRGLERGIDNELGEVTRDGVTDAQGWNYLTPLKAAVRNGHADVVATLLKAGADVDHTARGGTTTALGFAVSSGRRDLVELLVSGGANVDQPSGHMSRTPLMLAWQQDDLAMVETLTKLGASTQGIDEYRLFLAAERGDEDAVRVLASLVADVNVPAPNGSWALLAACSNGHSNVVSVLVDQGARLNTQTLENAAYHGHFDLVSYELECGVGSVGSKSKDRDSISEVRRRCKDAGHKDLLAALRDLEVGLGLKKPLKRA